jgi:hypothetical protein
MAVVHADFLRNYLSPMLLQAHQTEQSAFAFDPVLQLAKHVPQSAGYGLEVVHDRGFADPLREDALMAYASQGIVGVFRVFCETVVDASVDADAERRIVALKSGFPTMPATTASKILEGFKIAVSVEQVRRAYASYGWTHYFQPLSQTVNFVTLNRRLDQLQRLVRTSQPSDETQSIQRRYQAMCAYLSAEPRQREAALGQCGLKRSLFFHYWSNFKHLGILGLIDPGKQVFRESKIGLSREARMVIDKLQHPQRPESFYVRRLQTQGIEVNRSAIAKVFCRWRIDQWQGPFVSDLQRLSSAGQTDADTSESPAPDKAAVSKDADAAPPRPPGTVSRWVERNFLASLRHLAEHGLSITAPGLLVLWAYLEELGVPSRLQAMGLDGSSSHRGYHWLDFLLLDVGRRFYGLPTASRACQQEEPTLALFCHLVELPCNDSLLKGLAQISESQAVQLRHWLMQRMVDLQLIRGPSLGLDFHHIDLDVELERLREFGKGPSPRKKICHSGFRPHIAWDLGSGTLVAAEFRKASARGTTTVQRFVRDWIAPPFDQLFDSVYLDSEYTARHVWQFLMDKEEGMGVQLTACLTQNTWVRQHRDDFVRAHENDPSFWCYYDQDHVRSRETFDLVWEYPSRDGQNTRPLQLACVVKQNIHNGKFRCFGSSKRDLSAPEILSDYSHRWVIENGIKDLVNSYYLDQCPGTDPHAVDVHFLLVSLCHYLYRMIVRDMGSCLSNPDGTTKGLQTTREMLFRQGSAQVRRSGDTLEVHFENAYSPQRTEQYRRWFDQIQERTSDGLSLLGGMKLRFILKPPHGPEHSNSHQKALLTSETADRPIGEMA